MLYKLQEMLHALENLGHCRPRVEATEISALRCTLLKVFYKKLMTITYVGGVLNFLLWSV